MDNTERESDSDGGVGFYSMVKGAVKKSFEQYDPSSSVEFPARFAEALQCIRNDQDALDEAKRKGIIDYKAQESMEIVSRQATSSSTRQIADAQFCLNRKRVGGRLILSEGLLIFEDSADKIAHSIFCPLYVVDTAAVLSLPLTKFSRSYFFMEDSTHSTVSLLQILILPNTKDERKTTFDRSLLFQIVDDHLEYEQACRSFCDQINEAVEHSKMEGSGAMSRWPVKKYLSITKYSGDLLEQLLDPKNLDDSSSPTKPEFTLSPRDKDGIFDAFTAIFRSSGRSPFRAKQKTAKHHPPTVPKKSDTGEWEVLDMMRDEKASYFVNDKMREELSASLPASLSCRSWYPVYCMRRDGTSYHTLYRQLRKHDRFVMLVQASNSVFGAFIPHKIEERFDYYGSKQTFVFNFTDDHSIRTYPWSGLNSFIMYSDGARIALGGGENRDNFALTFDDNLHSGTTSNCLTYNSPPLCSMEDFKVLDLQFWAPS